LRQFPVDELHVAVGRRIRAARQERHLSLAELGGEELSRSFLSLVERGQTRISLRALAIVAHRLGLPLSYFVEEPPILRDLTEANLDHVTAAVAYSRLLYSRGEIEQAFRYALWAAEVRIRSSPTDHVSLR